MIFQGLPISELEGYISTPYPPDQEQTIGKWASAVGALIHHRYGEIPDDLAPVVLAKIGDAITRRLAKRNQMARREGAGPFSVEWDQNSTRGTWFLPDELAELDDLFGKAGTRTYRTPAPNGVRYSNRMAALYPDDIDLWEV